MKDQRPSRAAQCGNSPAQGEAAARGAQGAPPSNTAPSKCIKPQEEGVVVIYGVDSLYLSIKGNLSQEAEAKLREAKGKARSDDPLDSAKAIFEADGHVLEVKAYGAGKFTYQLTDNRFRCKISSGSAKQMPLLYAQCASKALTVLGVQVVVDQFLALATALGEPEGDINVSRIDLYTDFIYLPGIDWQRRSWVGRAKEINTYFSGKQISGWAIGQGGRTSARLYDKSLEIIKSDKPYMKTLWFESGKWQPDDQVYRLEFQVRGDALREFGLSKWSMLQTGQGSLWRYLTESWLRLCIPNPNDDTVARWATHPLWETLSQQAWTSDCPARRGKLEVGQPPQDKTIARNYVAVLTSSMAKYQTLDIEEAEERLHQIAEDYYAAESQFDYGMSFEEKVIGTAQEKAKRYGQPFDTTRTAAQREQEEAVKREYEKHTGK